MWRLDDRSSTFFNGAEQQLDWEIKQKIEKEEPSCCSFRRRLQDLRCFKSLCSTMSSDHNQRIDMEHETENVETHP
ncbi:hypothetical protein TNCT_557061 [Trichonephila clavata]|uniref:Uncharacterized protein n=1 Tax=Trichonephila clavata TaxID=2740835 RepID=A0A8X6K1J1_TRICU|nr:hypothetical protein TNCT_557061 [Trichonephila clavata]